jgi:hypothetical protein
MAIASSAASLLALAARILCDLITAHRSAIAATDPDRRIRILVVFISHLSVSRHSIS